MQNYYNLVVNSLADTKYLSIGQKVRATIKFGFPLFINAYRNNIEEIIANKKLAFSVEEYVNDISEACKSPLEARRFIKDVEKVAKRYDANYFIVSDGASATHNDNNEAIRYCRNALKEWETKNGYNPYEDWNNDINDFSNYKNNTLSILMNLNTKLNLYVVKHIERKGVFLYSYQVLHLYYSKIINYCK